MAGDSDTWEERPLGMGGDFPRVADKDHMKDYEIGYYLNYVPDNGPPIMAGPVMVAFNTLSRINVKTGELRSFSAGPGTTCNEHIHVPSKKPGHEGYLIYISDNAETTLAEVIVLEAEHPEKGPLARIKMPIRLRAQVHGNWVAADVLEKKQAAE
jgi:carotenoid cleavage dioxygenase